MPTAGRIVNGNGCSAIRTNWFSSRRRFPRHFRPSLISIGPFSNSDCRSLCSVLVVDPFAPAFAVCCRSRYPTTYVRRNVHATDWLDDFNLNAHSFEYVKKTRSGMPAPWRARTHVRTDGRTTRKRNACGPLYWMGGSITIDGLQCGRSAPDLVICQCQYGEYE